MLARSLVGRAEAFMISPIWFLGICTFFSLGFYLGHRVGYREALSTARRGLGFL